jgi:hydroxyacylglutathione hydrolase
VSTSLENALAGDNGDQFMAYLVHQFLCLKDNFGLLLHDPATRATAAIDAPDAAPILAALKAKAWDLTDILITHHHADHVQGIPGLKAKFPQARVSGPRKEAEKIGGLDLELGEGEGVKVGSLEAVVIEVPGHTSGHIVYWFERENLLFSGDTLFAMGCGRGFEEPAFVLFDSLMKLARLPGETQIYCGHEYTLANAKFALSVDSGNANLQERAREIAALRAADQFTLPTTLAIELATNPFLRTDAAAIKANLGLASADPSTVFAELRERKNRA